ncbi:MAG: hypothetical protein PHS42_05770 [Sulfurimonas sp.]|nr:hypothetical protein [Sulfurimonas sp.]MDD3834964.1 hypothetical protein [Sulfurimonas sp.]
MYYFRVKIDKSTVYDSIIVIDGYITYLNLVFAILALAAVEFVVQSRPISHKQSLLQNGG